jgi:hypothetical protein
MILYINYPLFLIRYDFTREHKESIGEGKVIDQSGIL